MSEVPEAVEVITEIQLTVARPCANPNGNYVGLSQAQRERLGVQVGDTVEVVGEDGESLGLFTVGKGSKDLIQTPSKFTTNGVDVGSMITVRTIKRPPERDMEFTVQHAAETVDPEKHTRRRDIIAKRLGSDPDVYVTIPTALAAQIGIRPPPGKTIASIGFGKIKGTDGVVHNIAIVPTGNSIGFTTKAAEQLDIPPQLTTIRIKVDNGVLVIN